MKQPREFVLPPEFESQREIVGPAHAKYIHETVEGLARLAPATTCDAEHGIAYVEYVPTGDYVRDQAIVVEQTFGNGNGRNWACRLRLLQDCLPEDSPMRIISFPSPSSRSPVGTPKHEHVAETILLDSEEMAHVSNGHFWPVGNRQARVLEKIGVKKLQLLGYSQGASVGAGVLPGFADQFEVGHSGLFEPANLQTARSEIALKFAHAASGLDFVRAVRDTGLPVFEELQEVRRRDLLRQLWKSVQSRRGDRDIPVQRALESGLAKEQFIPELQTFFTKDSAANLLVVRGARSFVATQHGFAALRQAVENERLHTLEVSRYGHGLGNNLALFALLARSALTNTPPIK